MNKSRILLTTFWSLLAILSPLSGVVRTVDNNDGAIAMYENITDAYDAALDGDTILVAGSTMNYGTVNCHKRLHFVGPGYFLATNGIPGINMVRASVNIAFLKDDFLGDSSGSSSIGIYGSLSTAAGTTGIVVDKCYYVSTWTFFGETTARGVFIPARSRLTPATVRYRTPSSRI